MSVKERNNHHRPVGRSVGRPPPRPPQANQPKRHLQNHTERLAQHRADQHAALLGVEHGEAVVLAGLEDIVQVAHALDAPEGQGVAGHDLWWGFGGGWWWGRGVFFGGGGLCDGLCCGCR